MPMPIALVHYHEIGLKGRNRASFEAILCDNLRFALRDHPDARVRRISGRLLVEIDESLVFDQVIDLISQIPGVARVSCGYCCGRELDEMKQLACRVLDEASPSESFKVAARRSNTDFEIGSMTMNQIFGSFLCEHAPEKQVKMKDPDVTVHIEVIQGSAYIYGRSVSGVGGLPVGSAGKVVSLISAGIDSPVATWRMVHRGAIVIGLHFSGKPQTDNYSEYLVEDIFSALETSGGIGCWYVAALGDYQYEISLRVPPRLRVIFYRRLMFAVANEVAIRENARALVTGESLGQVASQTLDNIRAVDAVAAFPVFRPLIGMDKQEIINKAQELGTFDISIRNHSDCCTLFMPRSPETHADLDEVEHIWAELPVDQWVAEIVSALEFHQGVCCTYHPVKTHKSRKRNA
jgi:tRNA uracil 4-sulfurtransferase